MQKPAFLRLSGIYLSSLPPLLTCSLGRRGQSAGLSRKIAGPAGCQGREGRSCSELLLLRC